jgi:hypothetical protein
MNDLLVLSLIAIFVMVFFFGDLIFKHELSRNGFDADKFFTSQKKGI